MIHATATALTLACWSGLVAGTLVLALTLDRDRFDIWEDE